LAKLTHLDAEGRAKMVDVSSKAVSAREAVAQAVIKMKPETLRLIKEGGIAKGDVLAVAQVAGIMGAKKTSELIPMCHPLQITGVNIAWEFNEAEASLTVKATVKTQDRTGVEMEALCAVSVAALTVYDMCKAVDKEMTITAICLLKKTGGKSGTFIRPKVD